MASSFNSIPKKTVEAASRPVNSWRNVINQYGAVVSKQWRRYRTDLFLLYMGIAVGAFVVLAFLAKTIAYFTFDVTITNAVQSVKPAWFKAIMDVLTWIGFPPQAYIISALILIFLFVSGLKWEMVVSAASLVLGSGLGLGIKYIIDRPRPDPNLVNVINQLKDYSFPSGHVLYYTEFLGFMLFLAFALLKHSWWRTVILVILAGMISLIGISRIYEGQHWASDVIAAYLLGSVWLSFVILVYRWGKKRFFVNQPVAKETPAAK
jgi:undecaprenyl-diphosphatase